MATFTNYKAEATKELANAIKKAGFRVFLAERGTYGFYTDAEGSKVVSFEFDLGGFNFSGNYKSNQPRNTGTGWQLADGSFQDMFDQFPPSRAVGAADWKFTTLDQHLHTYQNSSKFGEL